MSMGLVEISLSVRKYNICWFYMITMHCVWSTRDLAVTSSESHHTQIHAQSRPSPPQYHSKYQQLSLSLFRPFWRVSRTLRCGWVTRLQGNNYRMHSFMMKRWIVVSGCCTLHLHVSPNVSQLQRDSHKRQSQETDHYYTEWKKCRNKRRQIG